MSDTDGENWELCPPLKFLIKIKSVKEWTIKNNDLRAANVVEYIVKVKITLIHI